MNQLIRDTLWKQFGASIDMLENAIILCPHKHWDTDKKFWHIAYHCIFYLDYYLTTEPDAFAPPAPFTLSEMDPSGIMPERTYTKEELLSYLQHGKDKCRRLIGSLTEETANNRWINEYRNYPVIEILVYNMRHVQHHAAQLNMLLRQEIDDAPAWVSQTKTEL